MRTLDLSPLFPFAVGFDRLPSLLDAAERAAGPADGYPPYNIAKTGEDSYRISVAVAGFGPEDLDVEVKDGTLTIAGKAAGENEGTTYLHRGIAGRAFQRRFQLADHVEVVDARLANGLLVLDLKRELPEALKPRRIEIKSEAGGKVIEGKKAA